VFVSWKGKKNINTGSRQSTSLSPCRLGRGKTPAREFARDDAAFDHARTADERREWLPTDALQLVPSFLKSCHPIKNATTQNEALARSTQEEAAGGA
jgi:hypothetical protein